MCRAAEILIIEWTFIQSPSWAVLLAIQLGRKLVLPPLLPSLVGLVASQMARTPSWAPCPSPPCTSGAPSPSSSSPSLPPVLIVQGLRADAGFWRGWLLCTTTLGAGAGPWRPPPILKLPPGLAHTTPHRLMTTISCRTTTILNSYLSLSAGSWI